MLVRRSLLSVYLDTITLVLALFALVIRSNHLVKKVNYVNTLSFVLVMSYLFAQSSWTTAWFLGDMWGRDFANYIWYVFNTSVFILLLKRED